MFCWGFKQPWRSVYINTKSTRMLSFSVIKKKEDTIPELPGFCNIGSGKNNYGNSNHFQCRYACSLTNSTLQGYPRAARK